LAVKIKLKKIGRTKSPFYRIVVAEDSWKRNGKEIEVLGTYNPIKTPNIFEIKEDRVQYWLSEGAQPTEGVAKLFLKNKLQQDSKLVKRSFSAAKKGKTKKKEEAQ